MHTSSTVVSVCILKDKKVLVTKRPSSALDFPDQFEIPGGHVEGGESLEQAAKREIFEEVGVEIHIIRKIGSFQYWSHEGKQKEEHVFLAELVDPFCSFTPKLDEVVELRWVGEKEALQLFRDNANEWNMLKKVFTMM